MKHYKQFYEIDNNRYYTIDVDDEMYVGTESILKVGKKKLFRKQDVLTMGFKLLKFSAPVAVLFNALNDVEKTKDQKYDTEELITYEKIDNKKIKDDIKKSYTQVIEDEIAALEQQGLDLLGEGKTELAEYIKPYIDKLKKLDPLANAGIDLVVPIHTGDMVVKSLLRVGIEHLYTEKVNAFTNNIYFYEQDCFGTLTIYRIITVKNVTKTIDTFIYDKKVVGSLLKTIYEEGR